MLGHEAVAADEMSDEFMVQQRSPTRRTQFAEASSWVAIVLLVAGTLFALIFLGLGNLLPAEPNCDDWILSVMNLLPSASILSVLAAIPFSILSLALRGTRRSRAVAGLCIAPFALVVNVVIMLPFVLGIGCNN